MAKGRVKMTDEQKAAAKAAKDADKLKLKAIEAYEAVLAGKDPMADLKAKISAKLVEIEDLLK